MKNLSILRKQNGLSQQKLGLEVGLASNTICQYESGRRIPDVNTLILLANYFQVSTDYLLGRETPSERYISTERKQLLEKIESLTDNQVDFILSVIEQIK